MSMIHNNNRSESLRTIAKNLGISPGYLSKLGARDGFPWHEENGRRHIAREEAAAWIAANVRRQRKRHANGSTPTIFGSDEVQPTSPLEPTLNNRDALRRLIASLLPEVERGFAAWLDAPFAASEPTPRADPARDGPDMLD